MHFRKAAFTHVSLYCTEWTIIEQWAKLNISGWLNKAKDYKGLHWFNVGISSHNFATVGQHWPNNATNLKHFVGLLLAYQLTIVPTICVTWVRIHILTIIKQY